MAPPRRLALVVLAGVALLAGMWAGLVRIGRSLPTVQPDLVSLHGPLMLGGFLVPVIGLERAVALGRAWAYLAPALAGCSSLALLIGAPPSVGAGCLVASSVLLGVVFEQIYRLRRESSTLLMLAGTLVWGVGNAPWLSGRAMVHLAQATGLGPGSDPRGRAVERDDEAIEQWVKQRWP